MAARQDETTARPYSPVLTHCQIDDLSAARIVALTQKTHRPTLGPSLHAETRTRR